MRRFRIPEVALGFLLATAIWVVVLLFALDPTTYHQICEPDQYGHERCAAHNLLYVILWYVGYVINAVTITAAATVAIAWFTLTLKRSTDNLWKTADDQIKLARDDFNATHRPKIRIKNVWLMQQLLPDTPVAVDILLVNVGNVPAVIANIGLDFNVINPELGMLPGNLEPPRVPTDAIGMICGLGFTIRINGISSRAPLDEARIDAIEQGRRTLCCFGAVEYFDTGPEETRRIRRTSFYRIFKPFPESGDGIGRFVLPEKPDPDYEYED